MNILECNARFDISLRKLRLMLKAGVLNVTATPDYWQRVRSDMRKGKMSARSVALAFAFRDKFEATTDLTSFDRKVLSQHFASAGLPPTDLPKSYLFTAVTGAGLNETKWLNILAVRILLTCQTDYQMNLMSNYLVRAFTNARNHPDMRGWWSKQLIAPGKHRIIYARPNLKYDL